MQNTMKKSVKITIIIAAVIVAIAIIGGVITGIVMAVNTIPYEGVVTDNKTGQAIANVSVSDGNNVVRTDANGKYKLKGWHKSQFVTVSIPSGYWTEDYYIRKADRDKSYDFKLDKLERDMTDHTFLQVTDSEINENGVGEWINEVKNEVAETQPAFIIHTGDICYEAGLKQHIKDMNHQTMGVPVRYAIGNHDYVSYGAYGEKLFEENYGPVWYSFDVGNIHYVVTPMGHGDVAGRYSISETWRWLANDLANVEEGKKIVIFNHDNASDETDFVVKYGSKQIDLKAKGLIGWIFGHWHYNMVNVVDGVYNICTSSPSGGGIDSSPAAIRQITFKGTEFKSTSLKYIAYNGARAGDPGAKWQTQLSGRNLYSSAAVDGANMYAATIDDSYPNNASVNKIDITTGAILWSFSPDNSVRSDIFYVDNKVIFQDVEGRVYALNGDGILLWKKDLNLTKLRNTTMSIIVENNIIYCGNSQKVSALQVANGNIIWESKIKKGENSPYRLTISGDTLLVGAHWDRYYFINKASGKLVGKSEETGMYTTVTPYISGNKLLTTTNNAIIEMNINGKTIRKVEHKDYVFNTGAGITVIGDVAYMATSNRGIVAVNMSDLSIKWNFVTGTNMFHSSPYTNYDETTVENTIVAVDGVLYFGANDGHIYAVDSTNGSLIAKHDIGSPITSELVFVGSDIIALDFEGRVTRLPISALS